MKKCGVFTIVVVFLVTAALSCYAGAYMRDKTHEEYRKERFESYISFAISEIEEKDALSIDGGVESVCSSIWVAHELCDDPGLSAELNDLWYTLVYDEDAYASQPDALAAKLKDILERSR